MLPDLLERNLDIVFCGSAAGTRSAELGQWFARRGNRFWPTLAEVNLTPVELRPAEYARLLEFGIGLTDLVKDQAGPDDAIRFLPDDRLFLLSKLILYQPRYLCFNGKRAAQEFLDMRNVNYGPQPGRIGRTVLYVAPSTSGVAGASWDLSVWRDLARRVRRKRGS